MRQLEPETQAVLEGGRHGRRTAILFDFGPDPVTGGVYGFWWGDGPLNWNGITFVGSGSVLDLDAVAYNSDGSPSEVSAKLTAIPNSDLTPDVLGNIENYNYHLRPAIIYEFRFDPDTGQMTGTAPVVLFRGTVDQIPHDDQLNGDYSLTAKIRQKSAEFRNTGHQKRDNDMQTRLNGGVTDRFFEHAADASVKTLKWGTGGNVGG